MLTTMIHFHICCWLVGKQGADHKSVKMLKNCKPQQHSHLLLTDMSVCKNQGAMDRPNKLRGINNRNNNRCSSHICLLNQKLKTRTYSAKLKENPKIFQTINNFNIIIKLIFIGKYFICTDIYSSDLLHPTHLHRF